MPGRAITAVLAIASLGCGGAGSSSPGAARVEVPSPVEAAVLVLAPMRFEVLRATVSGTLPPPSATRPWPTTELTVDGAVVFGGEVVGRLSPDGTFATPSGDVVAHLDAEGRIHAGDTLTDGTIDAEGTLRNGGPDELRIDADGHVHGTHADAPELRVTGVVPASRRTAMFVVVVGLLVDGTSHVSVDRVAVPH